MSQPTEIIVGIDLGTTNSAIAAVIDGQLTVIPVHGQSSMPSVVGLDPTGRLLVGQPAKNQQISAPESTVTSVKRLMGTEQKVTLGEKSYSPEEISSIILGELKRAAEAHLGRPVSKAVITVPAFFNEQQRKATQVAGQLAGLEVLRVINEPTAAALAYGAGLTTEGTETLLVYDLGGGTFDVSIVQVESGIVEVKSSHGDTHLGGDDFDDVLVAHALEQFTANHSAEATAALPAMASRRLKGVMENIKIRLSDDPFASVREEYLDDSRHLETEVSRQAYEGLIQPFLEKTLDCVQRALADAKVTAVEIDKVMLVGGATRTPIVQDLLRQRLGQDPRHEINPDLIVAMGAAIQGAALTGQSAPAILIDITAHTYSNQVLIRNPYPVLICAPIIHRGTPLPVRKSEVFSTAHDCQESVEIVVFQGEGMIPDHNTEIGRFFVEGLSKDAPEGNPVVIQFALDLNGLLTVTASEKLTGVAKTVTLDTRGQHLLNLDSARQNLANLFALDDAENLPNYDSLDFDDEAEDEDEDEGEEDADDETADEGNADETAGEKPTATQAASATAPAGLLASAKSLRQRAEALLQRGVAETDAKDIQSKLTSVANALKAREWSNLQNECDALSDVLFYLED
jgi:molecular chaperone DnaK